MSFITKMIELCLMGQAISASEAKFKMVMKGLASILVMAVIGAIFGFIAMGCVYGIAYTLIIENGVSSVQALSILLAVTLLVLAVIAFRVRAGWENLSATSERMVNSPSPLGNAAGKIFGAFMQGFEGRKTTYGPL